jgi:hypothetical protein
MTLNQTAGKYDQAFSLHFNDHYIAGEGLSP